MKFFLTVQSILTKKSNIEHQKDTVSDITSIKSGKTPVLYELDSIFKEHAAVKREIDDYLDSLFNDVDFDSDEIIESKSSQVNFGQVEPISESNSDQVNGTKKEINIDEYEEKSLNPDLLYKGRFYRGCLESGNTEKYCNEQIVLTSFSLNPNYKNKTIDSSQLPSNLVNSTDVETQFKLDKNPQNLNDLLQTEHSPQVNFTFEKETPLKLNNSVLIKKQPASTDLNRTEVLVPKSILDKNETLIDFNNKKFQELNDSIEFDNSITKTNSNREPVISHDFSVKLLSFESSSSLE